MKMEFDPEEPTILDQVTLYHEYFLFISQIFLCAGLRFSARTVHTTDDKRVDELDMNERLFQDTGRGQLFAADNGVSLFLRRCKPIVVILPAKCSHTPIPTGKTSQLLRTDESIAFSNFCSIFCLAFSLYRSSKREYSIAFIFSLPTFFVISRPEGHSIRLYRLGKPASHSELTNG